MNGLPYYKAYPRDFFDGTVGMDLEVKGAYRLVLDLIYMHGGRLADEPRFISGHLGCSVKKWWALRAAILATGKIFIEDGQLGNIRADKVVDDAKMFQSKQRDNATGPRKNNDIAKATALPEPSHTDTDTEKRKRETDVSPKSAPGRGSRLTADWRLPKPWGEWAAAGGLSGDAIRREADRFRDYWISKAGKDGAKADWEATWRNWIRKRLDEMPQAQRKGAAVHTDFWTGPML